MHSLIKQQVEYNLWANNRIVEVAGKLDPKLLDVDLKSSFPSVRKTIFHILDAELIWLSRMENKILSWPPTAQFKDPAIEDLLKTSQEFLNFVESKSEEFFHADSSFNDLKGHPYTMNNAGIVMHVVNHGTFHRGQIITLLRELGVTELPPTDLIKFIRGKVKA